MKFKKLLLEISKGLVSSELEELKYLCTEYIPEGEIETIKYGFKLFAALERRGKLSQENRDLLASLLGDIQRIDLKNKLLETEGKAVKVNSLRPLFNQLEVAFIDVRPERIEHVHVALSPSWFGPETLGVLD